MKTYFKTLKSFKNREGIEEIKHVFQDVAMGEWTVTGFLKGNEIILRCRHKDGR
jgi:hypothetical protein